MISAAKRYKNIGGKNDTRNKTIFYFKQPHKIIFLSFHFLPLSSSLLRRP